MAIVNPNKPAGLAAVKHQIGHAMTGQINMYTVLAADTNPYFPGDLVALTGSGDTRGIPGITLATAGNTAVGVVASIGINPDGGPYINPNNADPRPHVGVARHVVVGSDAKLIERDLVLGDELVTGVEGQGYVCITEPMKVKPRQRFDFHFASGD